MMINQFLFPNTSSLVVVGVVVGDLVSYSQRFPSFEVSINNIMYNSTLEKLVEKYSKTPPQANSLVFSRLSIPTAQPTQYIKPSAVSNNMTYSNTNEKNPAQFYHLINSVGLQNARNNCEDYLFKSRESIISSKLQFSEYSKSSIQSIQQKLTQEHENIKKTILNLLEEVYRVHNARVVEELQKHKIWENQEFASINKKIDQLENEIQRLMIGLRSENYRKFIAEVALTDFDQEIKAIIKEAESAQESLLGSHIKVKADQTKLKQIQLLIKTLFTAHHEPKPLKQNKSQIKVQRQEKRICNFC